MGELHLEIIVDRLMREFKVEANVGKPQVAYRETITREAEGEGKFVPADRRPRPVRPRRMIRIEPLSRGTGFEFENDDHRRRRSRASTSRRSRRGSARRSRRGRLAGFPLVDVKVSLFDGTYHEVDSSEMAFKIAGSMALQGRGARRPSPSCSSR